MTGHRQFALFGLVAVMVLLISSLSLTTRPVYKLELNQPVMMMYLDNLKHHPLDEKRAVLP